MCVCWLSYLIFVFQCFQCSCTVILLVVLYLNTGWLSPVILSSFLTVWWLLLFPSPLCYPRLLLFCLVFVSSVCTLWTLFRSSSVYSIDDYWFATLLAGSGGDAHPFVNDCLFSIVQQLNNVYICRHLKKDIWGGFSLKCSVTFSSQVRKRDSLSIDWSLAPASLSLPLSLEKLLFVDEMCLLYVKVSLFFCS